MKSTVALCVVLLSVATVVLATIRSDDFVTSVSTRVDDGFVVDERLTPHGRVVADWFDRVVYFPAAGGAAELVCQSQNDPKKPAVYDDQTAGVIRIPFYKWFPERCDFTRPGQYAVLSKRWVRPLFGLNLLGLDLGSTRLLPSQWQWTFTVQEKKHD